MKKTITKRSIRIFLICLIAFIGIKQTKAQTALGVGDIMLVGFNSGANGPSGFKELAWTPMKDLEVGTVIRFSLIGFNSTSSTQTTNNVRAISSGILMWTANAAVPKGTVVMMYNNGASPTYSSSRGTCANQALGFGGTGNIMTQSTSGLRLFIYYGGTGTGSTATDFSATATTGASITLGASTTPISMWLTQGSQSTGNWGFISSGTLGNFNSYQPSDLTGVNATAVFGNNTINGYYNGTRTLGTAASYRAAITDTSKWVKTKTTSVVTIDTTRFTFGTTPSFTGSTALSACQGASTSINSNLTITDAATSSVTETWSITTNPVNGTLGGFNKTASANGGTVTPSGLTYTPTNNYIGKDSFIVQVSNGSNTASQKVIVTVNATPNPGTISTVGSNLDSICATAATQFQTNGATGGTWSSSNSLIASVNPSGTVVTITGTDNPTNRLNGGNAIIYYKVTTSGCGADSSSKPVYIRQFSDTGTVTPASAKICVNATLTFSSNSVTDGTPRYGGTSYGHTWISGNTSIVTINSSTGLATGKAPGTSYIRYYTTPNGCGSWFAQRSVTVVAPPNAGSIIGATSVCANAATTLTSNGDVGGTWSNSFSSVASVNNIGVVTGISAGVDSVKYTVASAYCGSRTSTKALAVLANYTVTASAGSNGTISNVGATTVCSGNNSPTYTITPNIGYNIDDVKIDGVSQGPITSFTFNNVTANRNISATFILNCLPTTSITDISLCPSQLPYNWNGNRTAGGTYTYTTTNSQGCDSVATLNLTITTPSSSSETVSACNNYTWNGINYTTSGVKTYTTTNSQGCDSLVTLNLTINVNSTSNYNESVCPNQLPYSWNGLTFYLAGTQTVILTNANGCDSSATLNLAVNSPDTSITDISVCPNQLPYSWNGLTFYAAGTQTATLTNANGCDSSATLNLAVNSPTTSITDISICYTALPYVWNGLTLYWSGTETATLLNANGCDSSATINLTVNYPTSSFTSMDICPSALPYTWNGLTFYSGGSQTITGLINSKGCDSSATFNLNIKQPTSSNTDLFICPNELPYTWNGLTFNAAESQTKTGLINSEGCDSSATLNLSIGNANTLDNVGLACNAYLASAYSLRRLSSNYSGPAIQIRRSSDDSTQDIGFTSNGDLDTANLKTFISINSGFVSVWYDQSGNSRDLTQSSISKQPRIINNGVIHRRGSKPTVFLDDTDDGMLYTGSDYLNGSLLSVNLIAGSNSNSGMPRRAIQGTNDWFIGPYGNKHSWASGGFNQRSNTTWSRLGLESFTVIQPSSSYCTSWRNGVSQTMSANNKSAPYKMQIGADGAYPEPLDGFVSEFFTFNTELNTAQRNSLESSQFGYYNICLSTPTTSTNNLSICSSALPYSWNGLTFAAAGTQTAYISNSGGCDSIATLSLTVKRSSTSTTTVSVCNNYIWNGINYTTSGAKTYTTTNSLGCDSVATLNLTIKTPSSSSTSVSICSSASPYTWNGVNYTTSGIKTFTTTNSQGCDSIATLNLTIKVPTSSMDSITINPGQLPYSWNGLTFDSAGTQTANLLNSAGCDSAATLTLSLTAGTVAFNLKAMLQGFYLGNGKMIASPYSVDGVSPMSIADTITVELRENATPFNVVHTIKGLLDTAGNATITFPGSVNGNSYYVVVGHRNSIAVWSTNPVIFSATTNYDFTSSISSAYGSNLAEDGGVFMLFSGDINQDGSIDFADYPDLDISSSNGDLGYLSYDLNGDGAVDFGDYPLLDINSSNGVIILNP